MGDRGNIVIPQDNGDNIFLYTHWRGSEIGSILQNALKKKWRWDDPSYLARIIFEEMIKGNEGSETGFGIATIEMDNNHPNLYVNCTVQTVQCGVNIWSFDRFITLSDPNNILFT